MLVVVSYCSYAQHADFRQRSFTKADSIAQAYEGASLKDPDALADKLITGLDSDVDKYRAIFRWITSNVSYDRKLWSEFNSRSKSKKKKETFGRRAYAKAMKEKSTICYGYSYILQQMCRRAGIECEIVNGYERTIQSRVGSASLSHCWNAVRLDGRWYLSDPTWASGGFDEIAGFFRRFDEQYFLADPDLLLTNHYPEDKQWVLTSPIPTLREFVDAPLKLQAFRDFRINQYFPLKGIIRLQRGTNVKFRFTSNSTTALRKATVYYFNNGSCESQHILKKEKDGFYSFTTGFAERGNFKVFVSINGEDTFAYEVQVR